MRIISNFKDFYDVLRKHDREKEPLYIRKSIKKVINPSPFPCLKQRFIYRSYFSVQTIGFCGLIYPLFVLVDPADKSVNPIKHFLYTIDEVDQFIENKFSKEYIKYYQTIRGYVPFIRRRDVLDLVSEYKNKMQKFKYLFEDNLCPIFIANGKEIEYNAKLKDVEFYKRFDSYSAYVEIRNFLGGLANPQKEIPTIPDSVMLEVKGFDPKYSFRKEKRKK